MIIGKVEGAGIEQGVQSNGKKWDFGYGKIWEGSLDVDQELLLGQGRWRIKELRAAI
jgi:hypothetical protein